MPVDVTLAGGAFVLMLFVLGGGPLLLADWSRKRRQQEIARQIALTDALDAELGPIVAPIVRKPLVGSWEIHLTIPIDQTGTAARVLSVVDCVFADVDGAGAPPYRIFLTTRPTPWRLHGGGKAMSNAASHGGGVPIMDIYEQIAKERMESALRDAEQRRALRSARASGSPRVCRRSVLVRLRQWISDRIMSTSSRPGVRSER
jgi:hypothetical protein